MSNTKVASQKMKNQPIEVPMYFVDGFVDGLEKKFPESSSNHGEISSIKHKTINFLRQSGNKIRKIEETRKAILDDPTQTEQAKAVNTWKYAKDRFNEIEKEAKSLPDLSSFIKDMESGIDDTITDRANTNFAREARQRIAEMSEEDRGKFVSKALSDEDYQTSAYVLGAPAFLSGISDAVHEKLKKRYKKEVFTEEMKALEAMKSLDTHLQKGLKATEKTLRDIHSRAALNDAIDKSANAQKLMNEK